MLKVSEARLFWYQNEIGYMRSTKQKQLEEIVHAITILKQAYLVIIC